MPYRVLVRHPLAIAGAILTTVTAVLFIALTIAILADLLQNPYAGLIVFVALPALFLVGLLLTPAGMWLQRRKLARDPAAATDWPVFDFRRPATRRFALIVIALTAANLIILLLAGYGTLRWMESPTFCGQVCHEPMHPQFTAWQNAPHARIACETCHIGEGGKAFLRYKLVGVRQLYHVATRQIPRPIPAVADLRPALEICGHCHSPSRDHGERLRILRAYADDETNTETVTTLQLHVGGAGRPTLSGRAIHWHADPGVRVEYVATDADRQTIPWVKVTSAQGQVKEYVVEGTTPQQIAGGEHRVMNCVDCHNASGHRISPSPDQAVDRALAAGEVSRTLPFVRREGVKLVKADYPGEDAARQAIDRGLRDFYASRGGEVDAPTLARAVSALQAVYQRNVFPTMKITYGVYPDNLGHMTSPGCFRCHDASHNAADGTTISADCEYCHKQMDSGT